MTCVRPFAQRPLSQSPIHSFLPQQAASLIKSLRTDGSRPAHLKLGTTAMTWIVYILECADKSLYTGITNDLERRLEEHNTGKGAKYTKRRGPLTVRYAECQDTKGAALTREAAIKSLPRSEKLALIATQLPTAPRG